MDGWMDEEREREREREGGGAGKEGERDGMVNCTNEWIGRELDG